MYEHYKRHCQRINVMCNTKEQAATAAETLGGATGIAATLSPTAGEALVQAAHAAFTHGLTASVAASAVILAVAAAVSVVAFRHVTITTQETP